MKPLFSPHETNPLPASPYFFIAISILSEFLLSFQPPLSHEHPLNICGNLFPKKWQYAHMLFLLSPCYHLYYHLIVTLNPLINNSLTWKVTSDNRKPFSMRVSSPLLVHPYCLHEWLTAILPFLPVEICSLRARIRVCEYNKVCPFPPFCHPR